MTFSDARPAENKRDGTEGDQIRALQKMGAPIKAPPSAQLPEEVEYLLSYWTMIRAGRRISYVDLKAFADLHRLNLAPWEAHAIMNIDSIFESVIHARGRHNKAGR